MYLRLVLNRYDDEALVSVLASPFVGVSNDALVPSAPRRRQAPALQRDGARACRRNWARGIGASSRLSDSATTGSFAQRPRAGLERLCERIVSEHDYDLAVLARWDGRRRYANLRKLARLARSYEELRGPDIEGFLRFVADQEAAGARESEAVAEEEGGDAVRLLTIHSAKGLEFKVVVVADAGRNPERASRDEILCLPDGRVGFKVVDPATGKRHAASGFDELREAERAADEAETPPPLLRRDDARDRPADRVRSRRPDLDPRRQGADPVDPRPPRGRPRIGSARRARAGGGPGSPARRPAR